MCNIVDLSSPLKVPPGSVEPPAGRACGPTTPGMAADGQSYPPWTRALLDASPGPPASRRAPKATRPSRETKPWSSVCQFRLRACSHCRTGLFKIKAPLARRDRAWSRSFRRVLHLAQGDPVRPHGVWTKIDGMARGQVSTRHDARSARDHSLPKMSRIEDQGVASARRGDIRCSADRAPHD
jgi:hypothetical protein